MTSKNADNRDPLSSSITVSGISNTGQYVSTSSQKISSRVSIKNENIEAIVRENERLKKRLLHVENLGRMVADYKQSNMNLSKENTDLQETIDELLQSQIKHKSGVERRSLSLRDDNDATSDENSSTDGENSTRENTDDDGFEVVQPNEISTSPQPLSTSASLTCVMTTSPTLNGSTLLPPMKHNLEDGAHVSPNISIATDMGSGSFIISSKSLTGQKFTDDSVKSTRAEENMNENSTALEAAAVAAFCERQANSIPSLFQEINVFNEVIKSDNPVTNAELRQLENIGGVSQSLSSDKDQEIDDIFASIEDSDSKSTGSVTAQFTKLAGVFARLAQRVMQTQKKARNSQAFCNSLLLKNDKLKEDLDVEKKKTSALLKTVEEKEQELKQLTKTMRKKEVSTTSRRSDSTTEETLAKENVENTTSDILSSVSDSNLQTYIGKLHNRTKKLETQRNEILHVNKQWFAQYNKLKEECNLKLATSNSEMTELKEEISGKQEENAKRKKDIDLLLKEAKKEIDLLQRQKGDLAKSYAIEHSKTQKQNEKILRLKSDMSGIQAENQRLNQALEAAYSIRQSRQLSSITNSLYEAQSSDPTASENIPTDLPFGNLAIPSENETAGSTEQSNQQNSNSVEVDDLKTQTEVLQQQVKIYREDFETERRDREKSQAEKDRLTAEMSRLKDEMRALNQQVRAYEQDFRQERREKQRLQRQLSRIQKHVGPVGNNIAPAYYYDMDVQDAGIRRHTSPTRDRLRYVQPREEIVIQTATTNPAQSSRRYLNRTGTNPPPPYTQDTSRHRRRPPSGHPPTTRRIRDEYLEPRSYDEDSGVVYPPNHVLNQF